MEVLVVTNQGKEIVAEKEVDLVVVNHDKGQVDVCRYVANVVDLEVAFDHQVHHC